MGTMFRVLPFADTLARLVVKALKRLRENGRLIYLIFFEANTFFRG